MRRSLGREGAVVRRSFPRGWPLLHVVSRVDSSKRATNWERARVTLTLGLSGGKANGILNLLYDGHGGGASGDSSRAGGAWMREETEDGKSGRGSSDRPEAWQAADEDEQRQNASPQRDVASPHIAKSHRPSPLHFIQLRAPLSPWRPPRCLRPPMARSIRAHTAM